MASDIWCQTLVFGYLKLTSDISVKMMEYGYSEH
jgi:hypothetical protein